MRVPDFEKLLDQLASIEVSQRWQKVMAPLFGLVPGIKPGETFAMMQEVFYMRGTP
jgi:L-rhamnose mutarotase